jgi:hypothetical protein
MGNLERRCLQALLVALTLLTSACSREEAGAASAPMSGRTPDSGMPRGDAIYGINVDVSYTGGTLSNDARVYVFLREPGKRMPLAVQHFPATELPKSVGFSGGAPDQPVELVVRLSPSGRVDRSPDDVEVVRELSGFRHPPQSLSVVLGEGEQAPARSLSGDGSASPAAVPEPALVRTTISIEDGYPFPPETVVFLVARKPGQPMPLAVKRLSVGELPAELELTDADAMTFSNRLSSASRLDLFARASTSGSAAQSAADWVSDTVHLESPHPAGVVQLRLHPPAAP